MRSPILLLLVFVAYSAWAGPYEDCSDHLPFGVPQYLVGTGDDITPICRTAYVLGHDNKRLVPLWVSYRLSAAHAMGCLPRHNSFAPDPDLPKGRRAELS